MRLYSMTSMAQSGGATADHKAVLLFWELDHYLDDKPDLPFLVAKPEGEINAYKDSPFNTHKFYPPKDNIVVAIGYSPQDLVSSKMKGKEDFLVLSLPAGKKGANTDLLSTAAPMYGSASNPFDKPERKETLKFMHAQSKVSFKAKLAAGMDLDIRNVRIELDPSVVTGSLVWDKASDRFVTRAGTSAFTFGMTNTTTPLNETTAAVVGTVYVVAELMEIPVKITVDKSDDGFKSNIQETTFSATLKYTVARDASKPEDVGKKPDTLYAGEAYTFTLLFDKTMLQLIGKKEPWEEGGKISIPIFPVKP